jgi:hypothetical protein
MSASNSPTVTPQPNDELGRHRRFNIAAIHLFNTMRFKSEAEIRLMKRQ